MIYINKITLTARAMRSINFVEKNYNCLYAQYSDKSVPEYRLRFCEVPSHKRYNQRDTYCHGKKLGYTWDIPLSSKHRKPRATVDIHAQIDYPCCDECQNYADCNDHALIVEAGLRKLKYHITLTARAFSGRRKKQGGRVNQSDGQILTLLTALCNQQTASNGVGRYRLGERRYQLILRMSQSIGGELSIRSLKEAQPTGTPDYKYRTNQHIPHGEKPTE